MSLDYLNRPWPACSGCGAPPPAADVDLGLCYDCFCRTQAQPDPQIDYAGDRARAIAKLRDAREALDAALQSMDETWSEDDVAAVHAALTRINSIEEAGS